jgi:hypothetical protein
MQLSFLCHRTSGRGKTTMSAKIKLTALAALLTILAVQGTASAQNYFTAFPAASGHQSNQAINRLKAKIPSKAFGSVNDQAGASFGQTPNDVVSGGKVVGRDPDANVRFEILRDGQYATSR